MIPAERIETITDGFGSRLLPVLSGKLAVTATAFGWTGRILARRLGLPAPNTSASGSLRIDTTPAGETWTREFNGHCWHSALTAGSGDTIHERAGLVSLRFTVELDSRWNTHMSLQSLAIGPIRLPIRRCFDIHATIAPDATTRVEMRFPGGGCTYVATFDRANDSTAEATK